ncbi:MAG TPA: hypothetical protein PLK35_03680 [Candidatus Moranbacteria bacterium]|nr:hypothetical protein [Candidatus Moranbacteria bacterium]
MVYDPILLALVIFCAVCLFYRWITRTSSAYYEEMSRAYRLLEKQRDANGFTETFDEPLLLTKEWEEGDTFCKVIERILKERGEASCQKT